MSFFKQYGAYTECEGAPSAVQLAAMKEEVADALMQNMRERILDGHFIAKEAPDGKYTVATIVGCLVTVEECARQRDLELIYTGCGHDQRKRKGFPHRATDNPRT